MFDSFPKRLTIDSSISGAGIIENKLPVCNFFDNVLLGKEYSINVLVYTIHGEPEFRILTYDGKTINYTQDSRNTELEFIKNYSGNRYVKEKRDYEIYYDLYQDNQFIVNLLSYRN